MTNPNVRFTDSLGSAWRFERSVKVEPAIVAYVTTPGGDELFVVIPEADVDDFVDALKAATKLPRVLKPRS